jgi:hypothetical protein
MSCTAPELCTPHEVLEIIAWYAKEHDSLSLEEIGTPDQVFVCRDYSTGGPGYFGPLYFVIWDGSPEFTEMFTATMAKHCEKCGRGDGLLHIEADPDHDFVPKHERLRDRLRRRIEAQL